MSTEKAASAKKKRRATESRSAGTRLDPRQDRFCMEYIVDYNGTKAALRAGYSETSAHVSACRLLKRDKILARVRELQAEQVERLAISADDALLKMAAVMRREEMEHVVSSEEVTRTYFDDRGRRCTETTKKPVIVEVEPKLYDVLKAAELIGKHRGMFTDNLKVSGEVEINDARDKLAEELAKNRDTRAGARIGFSADEG